MLCAIIPAAGQSKRMGAKKPLLPYSGQPLINHIITQLQPAVDQIYVVANDPEILSRITGLRRAQSSRVPPVPTLIKNPDPKADMLSSIRCALRALPTHCSQILVAPADHPAISTALVTRMIEALNKKTHTIIVPTHAGQRGHPLLFSAQYRNEILTRFEGQGLRALLQAHPCEVFELEIDDPAITQDLDHPEDYRQALERLTAAPPSTPAPHPSPKAPAP
jgi:molybdenum cofactor cytidylyltransferase